MNTYTLGNRVGKMTTVRLATHHQHIWNESHISVSPRVAKRIKDALGCGPYTNPDGHFGLAQRVFIGCKHCDY